ncbi:hypothetical protein LENED_012749 [Lentinula edodes]|uniref:Uncharacterized protein n=1 Tax=Lentinula edodes TaxID=5353 RepID=A0A1Q3ETG7_LENED|nr:hypothetical protein LENED_012749 [Lentinula edodes]
MPIQHSWEPLRPYSRSQASSFGSRSLKLVFRAIEAELPEPASEDLVTHFHIAHSEVNTYREVAKRQKQKIRELRKPVDDASSRSSDAYAELDSANARALRQQDRLEELEEMVCRYRDRAHVAEGLIKQYPEDEGLYKVELPSLSEVQRKLDASEAASITLPSIFPLLLTPFWVTCPRLALPMVSCIFG